MTSNQPSQPQPQSQSQLPSSSTPIPKQKVQKKISLSEIFDDETTGPNGSGGLQDDNDYEKNLREFMEDDQGDWEGKLDDSVSYDDSQIKPFKLGQEQENGIGSDDEDEAFTYSGESAKNPVIEQDEFFYGGIDRRREILEEEAGELSLNSGEYSVDLKDVMGSDEEEEEEEEQPNSEDQEGQQHQSQLESSNSVNTAASGGHDTMESNPSKLKNKSGPEELASTSPSQPSSPSFNSTTFSPTSKPLRRPIEYPTISRLRSSAFNPTHPSNQRINSWGSISSRSASGISLPSNNPGPSHMDGNNSGSTPPNGMFTPSLRSRSSSVSTSETLSKRKRSFPYGHAHLPSSLSPILREDDAASSVGTDPSGFGIWQDDGSSARFGKSSAANVGLDSSPSSPFDPPVEREICRYSSLRKVSNLIYPLARNLDPPDRAEDRGQTNGKGKGKGKESNRDSTSRYGSPSVMAVAGRLIAIGTESGWTLVFEYQSQELECVCGNESLVSGCGPVTYISISADHTFVGVGHATGHVVLYDLSRPSVPARHVAPHSSAAIASGRREGHLIGSRILHIGFVGLRHTAIVTADDRGLSFYHTLGKILGVSSNDTLRIFGKYRLDESVRNGREKKVILGMSPLPLGPIPHLSDSNQFVAILAMEKLLIVGLKPQPRTWFKKIISRKQRSGPRSIEASESEASSALPKSNGHTSSSSSAPSQSPAAGALAWYPASQSDSPSSTTINEDGSIDPTLAFSLGHSLMFLRFSVKRTRLPSSSSNSSNSSVREELEVLEESKDFSFEFPIRALQWLDHELLLVLTTQSLELFDLRAKRCLERQGLSPYLDTIINHDWFQKGSVDLTTDPDSERAEIGLAAGGSMKVHKGKVFFLTSNGIVVGTVLSWADRILQFVSKGDFLSAITLATSYYQGRALGSMVGLPEDRKSQQEIVGEKLKELMTASAQYAFSPDRLTDGTHVTPDGRGVDRTSLFEGIARVCAEACIALGDLMLLFEDLFDRYEENGIEGIFVEQMEDFIVSGKIHTLPTPVVQRLLSYRVSHEDYDLAEKIIWHVDPLCLDLDQSLSICLDHRLYAALIYVYNRALGDYVAPLVDLLELLKKRLAIRNSQHQDDRPETGMETEEADVYTIFSYLSVVLAGLSYPSQQPLSEEDAIKAKSSLYSFIFSGRCVVWPEGPGGKLVLSVDESLTEPTYPYLRLLLQFDSEAFLDALDVAFEDQYLDDDVPGKRITRQTIINILLEVTQRDQTAKTNQSEIQGADATFCHIFVARNAPKYPQFVDLSKDQVQRLLISLSQVKNESTREDRQLACECLLSIYPTTHTDELLPLFEEAQFYRILQSAYRAAKKWSKLAVMFLDDPDAGKETLGHLVDILSRASKEIVSKVTTETGKEEVKTGADELLPLLLNAFPHLINLDVGQTAALVDRFFPEKHSEAVSTLEGSPHQQLMYLRCFLGSGAEEDAQESALSLTGRPLRASHLPSALRNQFILLLCRFEPNSVVKNLEARDTSFFDLEMVAETCETEGAYDAVLWALNQRGNHAEVFSALDRTMSACALELLGIPREGAVALDEQTRAETDELALQRLRDLTEMAVKISTHRSSSSFEKKKGHLETSEMWYRLLKSLITLVQGVASSSSEIAGQDSSTDDVPTALQSCRQLVQDALSTLVSSTSAESVSYPLLFKRLIGDGEEKLSNASQPHNNTQVQLHYAEVRAVLDGMLEAYRLRTELLQITNRLFDRDLFKDMSALTRRRRRGWRPVSGKAACSGCSLTIFGPASTCTKAGQSSAQDQDEVEDDSDTDKRVLARRRRRMNRSATDTSINSIAEDAAAKLASTPRHPSPYHSPLPSPRPDKGKGKSKEYTSFNQAAEDGGTVPLDFFTSSPPLARTLSSASHQLGGSGIAPEDGSAFGDRRGSSPEMMLRKSRANSLVADTIVRRASVSGNFSTPSNSSDSLFSISQDFSREEAALMEVEDDELDQTILIFGNGDVWHQSCLAAKERVRDKEQEDREKEKEKEREKATERETGLVRELSQRSSKSMYK